MKSVQEKGRQRKHETEQAKGNQETQEQIKSVSKGSRRKKKQKGIRRHKSK